MALPRLHRPRARHGDSRLPPRGRGGTGRPTHSHRVTQRATFGRELHGCEDRLPGYATRLLAIADPAVVALSGQPHHPIVVHTGDGVDGVVFEVTDDELVAADGYEVDDYRRVSVVLASGVNAWVYVQAESDVDAWLAQHWDDMRFAYTGVDRGGEPLDEQRVRPRRRPGRRERGQLPGEDATEDRCGPT